MKTLNILAGFLFCMLIAAKAQSNDPLSPSTGTNQAATPVYHYQLAASEANQQTWQATSLITNANGQISRQVHKFVEIANGLNHWQNGQWVESQEQVDVQSDGSAAATNGQHQVYFPVDLYEETIKLVTPDGYQLKSQPIGLGYDDGSNIVMIGTLTNSTGSLLGSNQVIYADAFVGIKADLLYTYRKGGFEQDVILRQQPPSPESLGLNANRTRLQVYTEFFDTPNPLASTNVFQAQDGTSMSDQVLSFGSMKMVPGHAFLAGDGMTAGKNSVVVGKQWLNWEGRQILVEEVPLVALTNDVASLPKFSMAGAHNYQKLAASQQRLPARHLAKAHGSNPKQRRLAHITTSPQQGLVLDYNIVLTGMTDYTFRADTTYYVSWTVNDNVLLFGTTTFEGGAVIKFDPDAVYAGLELCGPVKCLTETYRPTIFTVKDDDSVGAPIAGSTGNPFSLTNYSTAVGYVYDGAAFDVHDLQIRYLRHGVIDGVIEKTTAWTNIVRDCEFYSVLYPIIGNANYLGATNRLDVRNVLIQNAVVGFLSWNSETINAVNATAHNVGSLFGQFSQGDGIFGAFTLTNSMVVNVTNWGLSSGINQSLHCANCGLVPMPNDSYGFILNEFVNIVNCLTNNNPDGVFKIAGAGAHYLTADSPYRNVGTTNIDSLLMADLRKKSTYAPVDYSNAVITTPTVFVPQAKFDTNANLDLGYHYPPIDYVLNNCLLTNTTLTITNGAIVAVCGNNGLRLLNGSQIISVGSALQPNLIVRSATVQELPNQNTNSLSADTSATANGFFRFTKFSSPAESGYHFSHAAGSVFSSLDVRNCEFRGGASDLSGFTNASTVTFNNNLFWRSSLYASNTSAQAGLCLTNNTFWGTTVTLKQPTGGLWSAFNNDFNSSSITGTLTNGYNAYLNTSGRLSPTNSHDIVSTSATNYQSGPLGDFYLSLNSALINAGNTNANLIGLYQFTTQTNQAKDAGSVVDIGYHYVACDTNGLPMASSGDAVPDYIEDPNGITNWLSAPAITKQPSSLSSYIGDDVLFSFSATGFPVPACQWYFNGTAISGATNSILELDNIQTNNTGSYSVVVSNPLGTVASVSAVLTVQAVPSYMGYVVMPGSATNFIFQGDLTYYVNSTVQLYGTTRIEGGTVIKYGNHPTSQLVLNGPLSCPTGTYHPALLTSKDDTSMGAYVSQATGILPTNYNATYLVDGGGQTNAYCNLHIKYAGIGILGGSSLNVWDCQFIHSGTAVSNGTGANIALHNVLVSTATNCVSTTGSVTAEFLTADRCQTFCPVGYAGASLTNCLLTTVTGTNGVTLVSSTSLASGIGVYRAVGGGNYYLTNSTYYHTGTTNASVAILADIATKTTRPPIIYYSPSVYFSTSLDLYPQAARDNQGSPDPGYHYDPLDYIFGTIYVTNASIVLNAGTAVGVYQTNSYGYAISIANNASLITKGHADSMVHILYYNIAQEECVSGWTKPWFANVCNFSGTNFLFNFNFTDWTSMAQDSPHFNKYGEGAVCFQNCQFHGGQIISWYPTFNFTNCLFERVNCDIEPGDSTLPVFRNNTVYGGTFGYGPWNYTNAIIKDNLFDRAIIPDWIGSWGWSYNGGNNAYVAGSDMLDPTNGSDIVLSNAPAYQASWLGNYYLPTNSPLINAGSTTADQAGLYHFTTQTNQVKETNSIVDIGYHYVAVNGNGIMADSDGDGISDYLEDGNGDGIYGAGDLSDWQDYYNGMPIRLVIMGGNYQCGAPGSLLPQSLIVKITNTNNVVLTNASLTFTAAQGGLTTSTNGTATNSITLRTDSYGLATVYFVLPLATNVDCYVNATAWSGTNSIVVSFKEHALSPVVSAGYYHALYLKPNGHVLAWGWESVGGVTGTTDYRYDETNIPVEIPGLTNIVRISTGEENAMAVGIDGTIWEWGWVPSTNSGYPYGVYQITPRVVDGLTNVVDIASTYIGRSGGASMAVEADGTVWEWGGIFSSGTHCLIPTQIAGITNAVRIAAGDSHVLVLLQNGTVMAFGYNWNGQLGDGTYNNRPTPVAVTNLSSIVEIAAGYDHSLAIDTNGMVWAWGDNYEGELGIGVSGKSDHFWDTNLPVQVVSISNIVQIVGGEESSMAVDNTGNVWQWGQWGYDSQSQYTGQPFQITNLARVASVSAGGWNEFFFALMPDGRVFSWGGEVGTDFPLGYGVTHTSNIPDNSKPYSVYYNPIEPKVQIVQAGAYAHLYLPQSLTFRVTDQANNPLSNAPVYVQVAQGDLWLDTNSDSINSDQFSDMRLDTDTNGEVTVFAYAYDVVDTNCVIHFYAASPEGGLGVGTNVLETIFIPQFQFTGGQYLTNALGMFLPITAQLTGAGAVPLTNIQETITIVGGPIQLATATNSVPDTNLVLTTDSDGLTSFWVYFPTNIPIANFLDDLVSVQVGTGGNSTGTNFNPNVIGYPTGTYWSGLPDELANPDGALAAWEMHYFGHYGLNPVGDYDGDGTNNLQEYLNGTDPNKITFSFSFPNQYVNTNTVSGVVMVLGGVPSNFAVLADNTNFSGATWTTYTSSNLTVSFGTNQGAHDIWVGLRGFPADAQQTWVETTLILDSLSPTITITNPADGISLNASRINVSGNFTAASLKQITVNGILAFVNGTNFEALNVPLDAGTNAVAAVIEDLTGETNMAAINLIGLTNSDGSMNSPVQLSATPVAGFAPLTVTFSVQTNVPGTIQQILYDFNGDALADFVTNNLDAISHVYATNGEYFPVVTVQTTVGRFSSVGGWNAVTLDESNQPIRINVQTTPALTTFASITDPVDLKWDGTNLFVLSGSSGTITEFDSSGTSIGSPLNIGAAASGFDVDAVGNIYVAVTSSNQVWKFFPTNTSFAADTNFGGTGFVGKSDGTVGTGSSQFNAPFDVAVSPDGRTISVSDSGNNRIQQFSASNGSFKSAFGSSGSGAGQFASPKGLTYDMSGTLHIVDSGNNRIVMAQDSMVTGTTGTNGTALGQFSGPVNLCIGTRGVYVADTGNNRVQKFDLPSHGLLDITPSSTRFAVTTNLSGPYAVAAVNNFTNDLFYVADTGNNRVILCMAPTADADAVLAVWNHMTASVAVGDIAGAAADFSSVSSDKYHQAFLGLGIASTIPAIGQIGELIPVVVEGDTAQYYFEKTIGGETITFPVEFTKENGAWKILEF